MDTRACKKREKTSIIWLLCINEIKNHGLTGPVCFSFTCSLKKYELNIVKQVRDELKRHDPCLVEFSKLSEQERNQNLQMAQDTLRWAPLPASYNRENFYCTVLFWFIYWTRWHRYMSTGLSPLKFYTYTKLVIRLFRHVFISEFFCLYFHWRTLLALGFYIGLNEDHTEERVKYTRLATKYVHV